MWSQNDSLKFVYRLCLATCVGFCWEYHGENCMLAATLLSGFEKFRPVILTTNLCACAQIYMAFKVFPK